MRRRHRQFIVCCAFCLLLAFASFWTGIECGRVLDSSEAEKIKKLLAQYNCSVIVMSPEFASSLDWRPRTYLDWDERAILNRKKEAGNAMRLPDRNQKKVLGSEP